MIVRHQAVEKFVHRLRERSALGAAEIETLHALGGTFVQARANIDIVSPGEITDHACLVVTGLVGRFGQLSDGRRQITALHIAGDMCDLHSVAVPAVRWSLQALSGALVLKIPHRELRRAAKIFPAIGQAFWRDTVADASVLSQWVVNIGRREARTRLAHLICEMSVRMENAGLGRRSDFCLDAAQYQLADALGLTAVHVNRTMRALESEGAAIFRGHMITIPDWDRLAEIANFEVEYLLLGVPATIDAEDDLIPADMPMVHMH